MKIKILIIITTISLIFNIISLCKIGDTKTELIVSTRTSINNISVYLDDIAAAIEKTDEAEAYDTYRLLEYEFQIIDDSLYRLSVLYAPLREHPLSDSFYSFSKDVLIHSINDKDSELIRKYADECEEILKLYKSTESVEEVSISEIIKSYNDVLKELMSFS